MVDVYSYLSLLKKSRDLGIFSSLPTPARSSQNMKRVDSSAPVKRNPFPFQKRPLQLYPAAETSQSSVPPYHPVTGENERKGVAREGVANGPRPAGHADGGCQPPAGHDATPGNFRRPCQDASRKPLHDPQIKSRGLKNDLFPTQKVGNLTAYPAKHVRTENRAGELLFDAFRHFTFRIRQYNPAGREAAPVLSSHNGCFTEFRMHQTIKIRVHKRSPCLLSAVSTSSRLPSRTAWIWRAVSSPIPSTRIKSSTDAFLILFRSPKKVSRAFLRDGPIPGILSSSDCKSPFCLSFL